MAHVEIVEASSTTTDSESSECNSFNAAMMVLKQSFWDSGYENNQCMLDGPNNYNNIIIH